MTVTAYEENPNTNTGGGNLPAKIEFARTLADSNLLPKAYQRNPANVLLAIELGEALQIPPIQAINGIHVIEGKPSASADLIAALIRRVGHRLRVQIDEAAGLVVAQLIRSDDPEFVYEARWDMNKARAAKLTGKAVWQQYPTQMLRSRAITEVARMGASDALYGVIYTPEELGDDQPRVRVQQAPQPSPQPSEPGKVTPAQKAKIAGLIRDLGLGKDEYLSAVAGFIGHDIAGTTDLTAAEADKVIAGLSADPAPAEKIDTETGEVLDAEIVPDAEPVRPFVDPISAANQDPWADVQVAEVQP